MENPNAALHSDAIDEPYADIGQWNLNIGEKKLYPKSLPGRWRTLKWCASSVWLIFFLGPYLRWGERQAVLFDLPNRQFHLFGITVLPQDLWILAMILLFFAILLAVATALAGRVWCGFFCFQTVWTDVFVWIEERLEGAPRRRQRLDDGPWTLNKLQTKAIKHSLWLLIALLTGISFVAWFMDAHELWQRLLTMSLPVEAVVTIALFVAGTYGLAGFLREQTCLWLCPYARIQGVMVDQHTLLPAYDVKRGEPRGRRQQQSDSQVSGDCIDCNLCVAVCPTGVDIRDGQQEGCITCALCIDACDSVMEKIGRRKGLIRYDSLLGLRDGTREAWYRRPRVWVYLSIMLVAVVAGGLGLSTLDALELKVIQHRQPLYVKQSDGSIQNRYQLKILNKTAQPLAATLDVAGPEGMVLVGAEEPVNVRPSGVTAHTLFVRLPRDAAHAGSRSLVFEVEALGSQALRATARGAFVGPDRTGRAHLSY